MSDPKEQPDSVDGFDSSHCYQSERDKFDELARNSPLVARVVRFIADGDNEVDALKMLVVMMCETNAELAKRLMAAESIAPKIMSVDGKRVRWDAPDEFVKVTM